MQSIKKNRFLYSALLWARSLAGRAWMRLAYFTRGVQKNTVFFSCFNGRSYADNPRVVCEALHAMRPDTDLVWQLTDKVDRSEVPDYVRVVKAHTPRALIEISTARVLVDNCNRPQYMLKFPGQVYVQLWHGDRGCKKILYDMDPNQRFPDYAQIDLGVSGSAYGTHQFRSAFRYQGALLEKGVPRNDALIKGDPERAAAVRARLGISADEAVLLYAPTFRDSNSGRAFEANFDTRKAVEILERATGKRWRLLTRAHDKNSGVAADGALDVTDFSDLTGLLLASDLLITDYSSCAGDFLLLNSPMILYQPDLDDYLGLDRGMYFDMRRSPYTRAETPDALYALLGQYPEIPMQYEALRALYGVTETGEATRLVCEYICERLDDPKR